MKKKNAYKITEVKRGRALVFERVKDWWGKDLPVNRGKYNFDKVYVDFYRDKHFFFQAEDGIRDLYVTGVQTCALPICVGRRPARGRRGRTRRLRRVGRG